MGARPGTTLGHYAALGVGSDASPAAIERAFARWAVRLRAGEVDAEAFGRAESAYHVLADRASRARHDRQLGLRGHPAWEGPRGRAARTAARRAVACLACGRAETARVLLEKAAAGAPDDPQVRSYLAVALARTRGSLHEAARHGEYAVERRPREAAFLFNLAEVYAAAGLLGRSLRMRAAGWRELARTLLPRG